MALSCKMPSVQGAQLYLHAAPPVGHASPPPNQSQNFAGAAGARASTAPACRAALAGRTNRVPAARAPGQRGPDQPACLARRASLLLLPAALLAASGRPAAAGECPELTTTSTGIQYCEITEGTGATPVSGALIRCRPQCAPGDRPARPPGRCPRTRYIGAGAASSSTPPARPPARRRAHYSGKLASNGAVFDSSYERGRPLSFNVRASCCRCCGHPLGTHRPHAQRPSFPAWPPS
jgi:hypothetical protein